MRFDFCGNMDCPEWVLSEIPLINRMSSVKLKLMMAQLVKKIVGAGSFKVQAAPTFDQEKLQKLCRDQKLDPEETRRLLAILEFCLAQASKHDVQD